jgi:hypothetical protein
MCRLKSATADFQHRKSMLSTSDNPSTAVFIPRFLGNPNLMVIGDWSLTRNASRNNHQSPSSRYPDFSG